MKKISKSLKDTEDIAKLLIEDVFCAGDKACIVGLYGNLGAGKTTLTKSIGKLLEIKNTITSPTFVIMKIYDIPSGKFKKLFHVDAYRLEDPKEFERLGWGDIQNNPENLVLIEWPEKVAILLPEDHIKIELAQNGENIREINIT